MKKQTRKKPHARRIFNTPEDLYQAFCDYKEDLKQKEAEWEKVQYVGRDGERKVDSTKLPLTVEGFYRYCHDHYGYIQNYFDNKREVYDDFVEVVIRIRNEVRENQILGGMVGVYNSSITSRLNGLAETNKQIINVEQPMFGDKDE